MHNLNPRSICLKETQVYRIFSKYTPGGDRTVVGSSILVRMEEPATILIVNVMLIATSHSGQPGTLGRPKARGLRSLWMVMNCVYWKMVNKIFIYIAASYLWNLLCHCWTRADAGFVWRVWNLCGSDHLLIIVNCEASFPTERERIGKLRQTDWRTFCIPCCREFTPDSNNIDSFAKVLR